MVPTVDELVAVHDMVPFVNVYAGDIVNEVALQVEALVVPPVASVGDAMTFTTVDPDMTCVHVGATWKKALTKL